MAGVDRLDQMLRSYQLPHECFKWCHTPFHRAREIALVIGYIIYCKASERNKLDPLSFDRGLSLDFWKTGNPPGKARPSNTPAPQRLTGQHFPGKYQDKKCKPDCEVCLKSGNWHQTSYYCKQCNIPVCVCGTLLLTVPYSEGL